MAVICWRSAGAVHTLSGVTSLRTIISTAQHVCHVSDVTSNDLYSWYQLDNFISLLFPLFAIYLFYFHYLLTCPHRRGIKTSFRDRATSDGVLVRFLWKAIIPERVRRMESSFHSSRLLCFYCFFLFESLFQTWWTYFTRVFVDVIRKGQLHCAHHIGCFSCAHIESHVPKC